MDPFFWSLVIVVIALVSVCKILYSWMRDYKTAYLTYKALSESKSALIDSQTSTIAAQEQVIQSHKSLAEHDAELLKLSEAMVANAEKRIELLQFLLQLRETKSPLTPDVPRYTFEDDNEAAFNLKIRP